MVEPFSLYTVSCDNCGREAFTEHELPGYGSREAARKAASADGWTEHQGNDYCPDCFSYSGDGEITIYREEPEED